jgi:hypothetical protein
VDARDHAGGGGNARARLRETEPVRQVDKGALNGVGDAIGEIGGRNRAGGRMAGHVNRDPSMRQRRRRPAFLLSVALKTSRPGRSRAPPW